MKIKVLSYNLHKGFDLLFRRYVLNDIKEALHHWAPDIVFLQELPDHFPTTHENSDFDSPLEEVADTLWPHTAYGKNAVYKNGMHGNAILSRYPFNFWENLDISTNYFETRGLLHGIISIPNHCDNLHLFCCHSNMIGSIGQRQLNKITERINSHVKKNEPMILAGDFNDWHNLATSKFLTELDVHNTLINAKTTRSYPSWKPMLSLDRIFIRGLKNSQTQVLNSEHWRNLSDHLPLFAELQL